MNKEAIWPTLAAICASAVIALVVVVDLLGMISEGAR
jgi:hypothetical protein